MVDVQGGYQSQDTRALESVANTRYPTQDPNFTQTIGDLKQNVKYIASYMQTMQKGIDKANEDTFQQIGDLITGMSILFGGGDVQQIDFGDLKYYLPAIGAMFGWDSTTPFPINLVNAAETFFFGYVVPTDAWAAETTKVFDDNLLAIGFTPTFIAQLNEFIAAANGPSAVIQGDINEFFTSVQTMLNIFGIGPNAWDAAETQLQQLWTTVAKFFGNVNSDGVTNIQDWVSNFLGDFLDTITKVNDWLTQMLEAFSSDGTVQAFLNFGSLFSNLDFTTSPFDASVAWNTLVSDVIVGTESFQNQINVNLDNAFASLMVAMGIPPMPGYATSQFGGIVAYFKSYISNVFNQSQIPDINISMSQDMQKIVDAIFQSQNGGTSFGNAIDTILTSLQDINQQNINGLTNLWNSWFGTHTPTGAEAILPAAVPNITAGTGNGQSADLLTHLNAVSAAAGTPGSTAVSAATAGMQLITDTLNALSAQVQQNTTQTTGATNSGQSFNINFNQYTTWADVPVNTTYGNIPGAGSHGSGHFIISNGQATWSAVDDGDVSAISIFNGAGGQAFTDTDYQKLYASLAGFPNGAGSKNFATMRANAITNPSDYVYGVIDLNGSSYTLEYELGCYIGGVQHIWESGTVSTLNLNFTMEAGVGNNPARYQGYSGATQVFDFTNDGSHGEAIFTIDSSHRYWGFRSDTYSNGQITPAPAAYVGCADNTPPTVPGSGIRLYRTDTAAATQGTSMGPNLISGDGTPFFDTVSENSTDISQFTTAVGTIGAGEPAIQVANAGRYLVSIRSIVSAVTCSSGAVSICPIVLRYNSAGSLQETRYLPSSGIFSNGFGGQYNTGFFGASEVIACQAGDIMVAGYYLNAGPAGTGALSALSFTGEGNGQQTYFEVALANWSFN